MPLDDIKSIERKLKLKSGNMKRLTTSIVTFLVILFFVLVIYAMVQAEGGAVVASQ